MICKEMGKNYKITFPSGNKKLKIKKGGGVRGMKVVFGLT